MTEEVAEQSQPMKDLYNTLRGYILLEAKYTRIKDKILPWREYTNYQSMIDCWDELWENPEKFGEGEFDVPDDREARVFRMGVCFGIEYERAYPTDERDEWLVSLEER